MKWKFKFGVIDVIIIVFLIAALVAGYMFLNKGSKNELNNVKVNFTVELKTQAEEFKDIIKVGDFIKDSVKGGDLGKVIDVEYKKATNIMENRTEGMFVNAEYEDLYDVYVTIEGTPTSVDGDIMISEQEVKIGKTVYMKHKNYVASGFIVEMDIKK